jgi:hypothetical protein
MIFIGYEAGTKGYRFFDPSTKKLVIGRDAIFDEKQPWVWDNSDAEAGQETDSFIVHYELSDTNPTTGDNADSPAAEQDGGGPEDQGGVFGHDHDTPDSQVNSDPAQAPNLATPPSNYSEDTFGGPLRFRTLSDLFDSTEVMQDYEYSGVCMLAADEPIDVNEALEENCWTEAMKSELQSIQNNNTLYYTTLPKGQRAIGLKWVFKVKRDPEGNIVKHKARLVAKGYAQKHGVDYEEVFAPVARLETVRLILALAAQGRWEVHHMDVKSAFLNGDLQEEVYVQQPPGFVNPRQTGKVLKLSKALYGLKQAPRAWNSKLDHELVKLGFYRSEEEHAVYKRGSGDSLLLIGVYVDDLIVCGPDKSNIAEFKLQMCKTLRCIHFLKKNMCHIQKKFVRIVVRIPMKCSLMSCLDGICHRRVFGQKLILFFLLNI